MGGNPYIRALLMAWLLVCLPVTFALAAKTTLTNSAKGGEWLVDDLKGSEGQWHGYSSKLTPINDSGVGEIKKKPGANISPSDEAEYFIDTKKPTITRIFPDGNKLDPDNPQIIYEIDDGKKGSGFYYFDGDEQSVLVTVNTPASYGKKQIIVKEGDITKIRVIVSVDQYLLEGEEHKVDITATDRVGNVATKSESFTAKEVPESYQLIESILNDPGFEIDPHATLRCRYNYPIGVIGRVMAKEGNGAIVMGKSKSVTIRFTATSAPFKDVLDGMTFSVDGPGIHEVSDESSDEVKIITLKAKADAKNGDTVTLRVTYPSEGEGDFTVGVRNLPAEYADEYEQAQNASPNDCPAFIRSKKIKRCENASKLTGLGSVCSVPFGAGYSKRDGETPNIIHEYSSSSTVFHDGDHGSAAVLTDKTNTTSYKFGILNILPKPIGTFEYDNDKKELIYIVEATKKIDLDLGRTRAVLGSNVGYSASKRVTRKGDVYQFVFSDVEEGNYLIRADLYAFGAFDIEGILTSTHTINDFYEVEGEPPTISNFSYDYASKLLTIQVDDDATPVDQLSGILIVNGKSYEVTFNESGQATYPFPQPLDSVNLSLSVFDLTKKSKQQILGVLGTKEFDPEELGTETYNVLGGLPANSQGYVGQGPVINGRQSFLYCPRAQQARSRISRRSATPIPPGRSGIQRDYFPINSGPCNGGQNLNNYCSASARRASARRTGGSRPGAQSRFRSGGSRCSPPRLLDRFSPIISNFVVDADISNFTASISDSGGPLDSIRVNYTVREDANNNLIANVSNASANGAYDGQGNVAATYLVDAEREIVEVILSARDSSGNSATATKKVITPKSPPNIVFSHVAINDAIGSTLLFAEFQDRSGIDIPLTELSIDGTPCASQLLSVGGGHSASRRSALKWVCRAQLNEGQHIFTAKGADGVGLVAQAQYPFDINYKPNITSLVLNDVNPEEGGVNVFSAEIVDLGKNVDVSGIELSIDGQLVPSSQYLFDLNSGQFNAVGPITISEGLHTAQLRVTDLSRNSDTRSLPFGRIANLVVNDPGTGDLQLDRVSVWELQNANGDGLINPGELVRLFPSFINTGVLPLTDLTITTKINVLGVNIESPTGNIVSINAGQSVSLLSGFDLRVDADFLRREGLQERIVPVEFLVTDGSGRSWQFVSDILVREPRESYQVVTQSTLVDGTTPVLSATNILPSISLNTPPTITPPFFDVAGLDVAYTGTLAPADSAITSVTYSLDGGAAIEIANVGGGGGGLGAPRIGGDGGFGFGGGGVTGNTFSISLPNTSFGVHVIVVTLKTADGDIAIDTDTFTVGGGGGGGGDAEP